MQVRRRGVRLPVAGQVTSLELFFDLVFVFTITQLTATVLPGGWSLTARTALLLLILWWMYGGYAWLTNAAPPVTPRRRLLLLLGMIGLFVTAMAIPHAYGSDRVVFACGYLVVVVVHAGMYVSEAARLTRGMVVQLLGWNVAGAVLGLIGALFFEDILVWWWLASFVVAVGLPRLFSVTAMNQVEDDGGPSFTLVPGHFVERHGLMLLIALGESVLAIGVGLGTGLQAIGLEQIAFAAISLLLAATLYWAYFGVGEDTRAEAALDSLSAERAQACRARVVRLRVLGHPLRHRAQRRGAAPRPGAPHGPAGLEIRRPAVRGGWPVLARARPVPVHPRTLRRAPAPGRRARHLRGHRARCPRVRDARTALPAARVGRGPAGRASRGKARSTSRLSQPLRTVPREWVHAPWTPAFMTASHCEAPPVVHASLRRLSP